MILLALFTIALAVALPKITADIQRDRDVETIQRGKQYVRAIKLYYKKFGAYPPNLDALVKTNDIRFLRKKYIDPTTGKADWKPIMMCQNKTPWVMGFFGQPLLGPGCSAMGGMMPGGGAGLPGGAMPGGMGTTGTTGSIFGNTPGGGSSIFSNSPTSGTGTTASGTGTDNSSSPNGTSGTGGTDQSGTGSSGGTDAFGNPTGGQTFGGGGIIGVSPASPKKSIYVYKKKDHYNQWEFLYNPAMDMMQQPGAGGGMGQPGTGIGQPGTGIGQPGGSIFGGQNPGGFGPGGNGGSSPIMPTPTPPPSSNPQ
jgi:hypothetical protein